MMFSVISDDECVPVSPSLPLLVLLLIYILPLLHAKYQMSHNKTIKSGYIKTYIGVTRLKYSFTFSCLLALTLDCTSYWVNFILVFYINGCRKLSDASSEIK